MFFMNYPTIIRIVSLYKLRSYILLLCSTTIAYVIFTLLLIRLVIG